MPTRFSDFNLHGEERLSPLGEVNSGVKLYENMPIPEHKALQLHFQQIDLARAALAAEQVDETDEEFFDFGPDDFEQNQTKFEQIFDDFCQWKYLQAQKAEQGQQEKPAGEEPAGRKEAGSEPAGE